MDQLMLNGGRVLGLIGLLVAAFAVVARLMGYYVVGGFQAATLLAGGMGVLLAGCFALLWVLTAERRP
jgi:uncharacterized membrane protein